MRFLLSIVTGLLLATADFSQTKKFAFGHKVSDKAVRSVSATDLYSKERGYGFELGAKVNCGDTVMGCSSERPFYFSVAVPEGNYRVTVTLGDKF